MALRMTAREKADNLTYATGALPPNPRPSLGDGGMQMGHLLARAGRALPQNLREPQGTHFDRPSGQTLAAPENPR